MLISFVNKQGGVGTVRKALEHHKTEEKDGHFPRETQGRKDELTRDGIKRCEKTVPCFSISWVENLQTKKQTNPKEPFSSEY